MTLYERYRFFKEHAGYSVPPGRAACALSLARAEQWAEEEGVEVEWRDDELPWESDIPNYEPQEVLGCILTHGDETVSLWGIADPDDNYKRVVQAELAAELQTNFFTALGNHVRSL